MSIQTIASTKLPELLADGAKVIDVRTPAEYKSVHVDGAELYPLDHLDVTAFTKQHGSEQPVYILCQSGKRATIAAEKFAAIGNKATIVIEGGTLAAIDAGVKIIRGQGVISIERQVRIAAGAMVFFGTLLGLLVHTGFFAIPAFVGAGLVFAGVTDTCGMGMMLTKMPWNR